MSMDSKEMARHCWEWDVKRRHAINIDCLKDIRKDYLGVGFWLLVTVGYTVGNFATKSVFGFLGIPFIMMGFFMLSDVMKEHDRHKRDYQETLEHFQAIERRTEK